ncbi:DUF2341 domain-containing protein, partial [Candidatus Woesearchaeota archaeon]|nr:DUF2341 domain-containing protein [Candidatus Woesearchaeota archaeon]
MKMKKTAYLLNILIIALLIVSSAGAAPFQIINSTSTKQLAQTTAISQEPQALAVNSDLSTAAQPVQSVQQDVQTLSPSFTILKLLKEQPAFVAENLEQAANTQFIQLPQDELEAQSEETQPIFTKPLSGNFGINRQALTIYDRWMGGLDLSSRELHIDSKEVSGDTTPGETFTITITATDSDDLVTRISLGRAPYTGSDFDIRDCNPASHSCTIEFEMSEAAAGAYTYMIKAKNERNQIVNDAITVNVVEHTTTSSFNFRTAAMDGQDYGMGIIDYVNSEIFVWGDDVTGLTLAGTPFATFSVPSNQLLAARYTSEGYQTDVDYFYFDSRLPSCSGESCTFAETLGDSTYTTSCNIVLSDYHYFCTLTGDDGYTISFDYRATTDPIGPNTIRRYNLIYPQSAPIVNFGALDATFVEGAALVLDLDEYIYDNDTSDSDITWSARLNSNILVSIDPTTHDAQFTQANPSWIGNELIEFVATDPEGNTGSDTLTIRVTAGDDNDPPVILSKYPDSPTVNIGEGGSRLFSIDAMDPDFDRLTITWRKGGTVAATDTFSYLYRDTDGVPYPLTVIVSDGTEEASAAWDIDIVEPIGNVGGVVTDSETALSISSVLVRLYDAGSGIMVNSATTNEWGQYIISDQHEGTYDLSFTKAGYTDLRIEDIMIYAGETTVQDAQLEIIPLPIGTLQGTVRNAATSAPLGGVLVEAMSGPTVINSTTTSASGTYSMMLSSGTYTVRFSKTGYDTLSVPDVTIVTGGTTAQNANLEVSTSPIGTISGTVTQSGGGALSGALVEVLSGMSVINSTTTTGAGAYSMQITGGVYDIRFTKTGYKTATLSGVNVPAGATTVRNYAMVKWWDESYGVKYPITIPADARLSADTQFPIKIVLNSSNIDYSDFQADGGDVRFVDSTDTAELPYFIEVWDNTGTSIVYVDVSVSPSSSRTIYLYGDSAAVETTTSDFSDTFGSDLKAFYSFND